MRIALDAMGGDHAPACIVQGSLDALALADDLEVVLFGDETAVREELQRREGASDRIKVVHTTQVVGMHDKPLDAVRQKKDSSICRMAQAGAAGEADAVISAGNTGACAAACQLRMRTLPGVSRSGIAVTIPAFYGPFVLLDVGANIQPKPHHLYQYAIMGQLYAKHVVGLKSQRVGLLSIGEEDVKGTEVIRQANDLIRADSRFEFVGNIEGRDLFNGACDVAVSDGFVGNVILKLFEGLSRGIFETISKEILQEDPSLKSTYDAVVQKVWKQHDYTEFGGAPLLGIKGVAFVCHGSSDARAIKNAIRTAYSYVGHNVNELLTERLATAGTAT